MRGKIPGPKRRLACLLAASLACVLLLTTVAGCGKPRTALLGPEDASDLVKFVADERIFIVTAFLAAAGFQEYATACHPVRTQIRNEIKLDPKVLSGFYGGRQVKEMVKDPETVMTSLKVAVSRGGPPGFLPLPLPGAHPNVPGLDRLLTDFYREHGDKLDWKHFKEIYENELDRIRDEVIESIAAILEVIPLPGPIETYQSSFHFNLLGYGWAHSVRQPDGPNHMIVYYRTDFLHSSFQQEFIRAFVEPQWTPNAEKIDTILRQVYPAASSALPLHHRHRQALAEESLIAALVFHFTGASQEKQQLMADDMFARGYILSRHFHSQIPAFLASGATFPDWYVKFYDGLNPDELAATCRAIKPAYEQALARIGTEGARVIPVKGPANVPSFSPDGSTIIFTLTDTAADRQEIWAVAANDAGPERLSGTAASHTAPRWSPDGQRLLFWSGRTGDGYRRIFVSDPTFSDIQLLTGDACNSSDPAWHPSGRSIAYVSDRTGIRHVYLLDLDTMEERQLTTGSDPCIAPSWSPDGTRLAFARREGPDWNLWLTTPDGSERRLTQTGLDASYPRWSPDGNRILFASGVRDQRGTLALVDPETGKITDLGLAELFPVAADWHPDGRRIVVASNPSSGPYHLVVLELK